MSKRQRVAEDYWTAKDDETRLRRALTSKTDKRAGVGMFQWPLEERGAVHMPRGYGLCVVSLPSLELSYGGDEVIVASTDASTLHVLDVSKVINGCTDEDAVIGTVGKHGKEPGQFDYEHGLGGVCPSPRPGCVLIAEHGNKRLSEIDVDAGLVHRPSCVRCMGVGILERPDMVTTNGVMIAVVESEIAGVTLMTYLTGIVIGRVRLAPELIIYQPQFIDDQTLTFADSRTGTLFWFNWKARCIDRQVLIPEAKGAIDVFPVSFSGTSNPATLAVVSFHGSLLLLDASEKVLEVCKDYYQCNVRARAGAGNECENVRLDPRTRIPFADMHRSRGRNRDPRYFS